MVQVSGLRKAFHQGTARTTAVSDAAFEVAEGAFFTLLGPSGCGKTTLLRCIAGLETPDAGDIRIADQVVFSSSGHLNVPPERRPIGMVFQSYAIWPHMTVEENVAFPLLYGLQRLPRRLVQERVSEILERVGLGSLGSRWATQLSGGQQQRLALARALVREPKVLLLDEPLSNLDANLRTLLREELKRFQRLFGVTTIYVTHDQAEALSLSDQVAVLRDGAIQQIGAPNALYEAPATPFVAQFVGAANVVEGRLTRAQGADTVDCPFGPVVCGGAAPAAPGTVLLCVRPEDVELSADAFDATSNTYRARILAVEFLGDHYRYTVDLAGVTLRALGMRDRRLDADQEAWVHLDPKCCRVLAPGS